MVFPADEMRHDPRPIALRGLYAGKLRARFADFRHPPIGYLCVCEHTAHAFPARLAPETMANAASAAAHSPRDNRLLASLPADSYEALLPFLEPLAMPLGLSVYESGGAQGYVYFPTTAIVSLLYVLADGHSAEIAVTGKEGLVGIALFMGGETTPSRAVVQSAGLGYRLRASVLKREFEAGGALQHLLLRFTQALITQMTQTAVCNRHHSVDQQLCRWLLLSLDRLPDNELVMTQELIANMLGVRREGVTEAAGILQAQGLIHYSRGRIIVPDRSRLEARVCECYEVVKREYDRLLQPRLFA